MADITYLSRERVLSTFMEDVRAFMDEKQFSSLGDNREQIRRYLRESMIWL